MSSNDIVADPGSLDRWKLWLITVHPLSCAAQRRASRSLVLAECSAHEGACPCGLFASMFFMIPWVCRACCEVVKPEDLNRAVIERFVVSSGLFSQMATLTP